MEEEPPTGNPRWAGVVAHQALQEATTKKHKCFRRVFFLFGLFFCRCLFWACIFSLHNVRVWMREAHTWRSCCDGVRLSKVKETDPIYSLICWGIKLHDVTLLQFDNYRHMFLISSCFETQVTRVLPFIWSFRSKLGEYPTPSGSHHTSCIHLLFRDIFPSAAFLCLLHFIVANRWLKCTKWAVLGPSCSLKDRLPRCVPGGWNL